MDGEGWQRTTNTTWKYTFKSCFIGYGQILVGKCIGDVDIDFFKWGKMTKIFHLYMR